MSGSARGEGTSAMSSIDVGEPAEQNRAADDAADNGDSDSEQRPHKVRRRTARACLQCRSRKQRCRPNPASASLNAPCERCATAETTCSFESEPVFGPAESTTPAGLAKSIQAMRRELASHAARLEMLERGAVTAGSVPVSEGEADLRRDLENAGILGRLENPAAPVAGSWPTRAAEPSPTGRSPGFSMDAVNMDPPIATLRALASMSRDHRASIASSTPRGETTTQRESLDPIALGLLSADECQRLLGIFFRCCQAHAPLIAAEEQWTALSKRHQNPALFLSLLAIGARFWNCQCSPGESNLHPQYFRLVALLDEALSRLLLRPTLADATIENLTVLLLYIQFMPLTADPSVDNQGSAARSRYNDLSAFSILGVATRFANFLNLPKLAPASFEGDPQPVTESDVARMRVWINLTTCEAHLVLSSGLPSALDTERTARVMPAFAENACAQDLTSDRRVAGLLQMVEIVQQAASSSGDPAARSISAPALKRANHRLDLWQESWMPLLKDTPAQHCSIPFTSLRWYRFALNNTCLAPLLSSVNPELDNRGPLAFVQALDNSLTAASQILLSLSAAGSRYVWTVESQTAATFPPGEWQVDPDAIARFRFAVDSSWVTHTYATIFLVLCYTRKVIDDEVQICLLQDTHHGRSHRSPLLPRPGSLLLKLIALSQDIFESVCAGMTSHPALDYRLIVRNAHSLLLPQTPPNVSYQPTVSTYPALGQVSGETPYAGTTDGLSVSGFFDALVGESNFSWPTTLFQDQFFPASSL